MPDNRDGVAANQAQGAPEVTVNRSLLFNGTGCRVPYSWLYEVTGPDGRRFDNKSIGELRRVLRRRYGLNVQIRQNWEGPARGVTWTDINNLDPNEAAELRGGSR
jgi:hypothetical protein